MTVNAGPFANRIKEELLFPHEILAVIKWSNVDEQINYELKTMELGRNKKVPIKVESTCSRDARKTINPKHYYTIVHSTREIWGDYTADELIKFYRFRTGNL